MTWLARAASRQDPLFAFSWDIVIQSPAGEMPPEYVEAIQVPLPKFDSDSIVFQARKYYIAKFEDYGVVSCRFYEDCDNRVARWLANWRKLIKDDAGNYEVPNKYKGTFTVFVTNPMDDTTATHTLFGVFPTQVPVLGFDSTGERITLEVEFSIDRTELS